MGGVIAWELQFVWISLCLGLILRGIYDGVLIIRRLIKHSNLVVGFEDFIFWMICCYQVFKLMYQQNSGTIRGFACVGVFVGMAVYHFGPSSYIVPFISSLLIKIGIILGIPIKFMKKPLQIVIKKAKMKSKKLEKGSESNSGKT